MGYTLKESITIALIQLMNQKNYDLITTKDIVDKAGVGRASFYRLYKSKDEVLKNYIHYSFMNCPSYYKEEADIINILSSLKDNKDLLIVLAKNNLLYLLKEEIEIIIHNYMNKKQVCADSYLKSYYVYASFGIVTEWIRRDFKESKEDIVRYIECYIK